MKQNKTDKATMDALVERLDEPLRRHLVDRGVPSATADPEALGRALAVLSPSELLLLFFTHCEGLDDRTVAKMLGMKPMAAARALRRLQQQLQAPDPDAFNKEFVANSFGPMPPKAKAAWQKAKRKPGRPPVGQGTQVISVSLEKGLLARSDALAKRLGIARSALIADGLRDMLIHAEEK